MTGGDDGNRTRIVGLEDQSFTTKLHPHMRPDSCLFRPFLRRNETSL